MSLTKEILGVFVLIGLLFFIPSAVQATCPLSGGGQTGITSSSETCTITGDPSFNEPLIDLTVSTGGILVIDNSNVTMAALHVNSGGTVTLTNSSTLTVQDLDLVGSTGDSIFIETGSVLVVSP